MVKYPTIIESLFLSIVIFFVLRNMIGKRFHTLFYLLFLFYIAFIGIICYTIFVEIKNFMGFFISIGLFFTMGVIFYGKYHNKGYCKTC